MTILMQDGIEFMNELDHESVQLIWTDPPFGTGTVQRNVTTSLKYKDGSVDEVLSLIDGLGDSASRVLTQDGVLAVCLDYRAVHPAWNVLSNYLVPCGEIIWSFGLGRPATNWWANKHNTILLFSRNVPRFHYDAVPTVSRKAPKAGYGSEKKVASVWDYTMSNTDPERVGYPNQKPEAIIEPFILVHTDIGDLVVDPFAGSGSVAVTAKRLGRRYAVADINPDAVALMQDRIR